MGTLGWRGFALIGLLAVVGISMLGAQPRRAEAGFFPWNYDDSNPAKWRDISSEGYVLVGLADEDDEAQDEIPIGFTFHFMGTDFSELEVTTNGVISLRQEGVYTYTNEPIPTDDWANEALFPWWDDLDLYDIGDIYVNTLGSAPNRVFIVQWDGVAHHGDTVPGPISFQAALCEGSNNIVFQYLDTITGDAQSNNGVSASVGIQESDSSGLEYSFNQPVLTDGLAIVFYPPGGSPDNCVVGLNDPTPTPTATATATPEATATAPAPTSTVSADIIAPDTGTGAGSDGDGIATWLVAAMVAAVLAAAAGLGAMRLRMRRT